MLQMLHVATTTTTSHKPLLLFTYHIWPLESSTNKQWSATAPNTKLLKLRYLWHETILLWLPHQTGNSGGGSEDQCLQRKRCQSMLQHALYQYVTVEMNLLVIIPMYSTAKCLAFTAQRRYLHPPPLCRNILTKQSQSQCTAIVHDFLSAQMPTPLYKQTY